MKLFIILICFALQHYLGLRPQKGLAWINSYAENSYRLLSPWVKNALAGVVLLVLPWIVVIAGIEILLNEVWFDIFIFLLNILILFFCLDVRNLQNQLAGYLNAASQGQTQTAFHYGSDFLGENTTPDFVSLARAITTKIFSHTNTYIFSVLFWYILTGIVGATTYALVTYLALCPALKVSSWRLAASQLQSWLDWIPARLVGFTYALMGHFGLAFKYWREHLLSRQSQQLAIGTGMAALELNKDAIATADAAENQKALDLVHRTIALWIILIALFTIVAWIQ